jgi:hypothetical protein
MKALGDTISTFETLPPFEEVHLSEVFHNVLSGKLTLRGVSSPTAFNDTPWNLQAC